MSDVLYTLLVNSRKINSSAGFFYNIAGAGAVGYQVSVNIAIKIESITIDSAKTMKILFY